MSLRPLGEFQFQGRRDRPCIGFGDERPLVGATKFASPGTFRWQHRRHIAELRTQQLLELLVGDEVVDQWAILGAKLLASQCHRAGMSCEFEV